MVNPMNHVDPSILAALKTLKTIPEAQRVLAARKRHDEAAQRKFETQLELLRDEVEAVIPKEHPLFEAVLLLTVLHKGSNTEPEFHSALEFPNGW